MGLGATEVAIAQASEVDRALGRPGLPSRKGLQEAARGAGIGT